MMSPFFALVRNDLRLFFSDRKAMLGTLCVPIGIASFFGIVLGKGAEKPASRIPVLVADADRSAISQKLLAQLRASPAFAVAEASAPEAREQVRRGQSAVALVVPLGFGAQATQALFSPMAPRPTLTFLYDPGKSSELQMAKGLLTQQVMQVVSQEAVGATELTAPCELVSEAVVAKDDGTAGVTHVFVGMAVQGLLFFAIDLGIGMVRDRRLGLWKRLRAAPLTRVTLLGSRLLSSALIGLFVLAGVFGFGAVTFGLRVEGSWLGFGLMAGAASLMVSGFGLLIAALGRTEAQCRAASVPAVLAMSFLGGAWLPSSMMPEWVQTLAKSLPSRWAIDGFDAVTWRGLDLASTLAPVGVLLAFTLAFTAIAFARFRWEAD